jgi:sterol desaturase/sphingolipid hydroxylase (fatty acid hydroxylase superfamily)
MVGWVSHAPHHSSEDYNLAVALRQGPLQALFSTWFYLPLAFVGVPFETFVMLSSINTIYQFWIHTELIGRLGPLEWILNTPSHHRVHHGCDARSIDRNHGGVFIVWDRLFGTFVEEQSRPVYGTVKPLQTWNPLRATWAPLAELLGKARASRTVGELVRSVVGPPEWQPAQVQASSVSSSVSPSVSSSVTGPRAPFDHRPPPAVTRYVVSQLVVVIGLSVAFLIKGPTVPWPAMWAMAAWLVWSFGAQTATIRCSGLAPKTPLLFVVVGSHTSAFVVVVGFRTTTMYVVVWRPNRHYVV